MSRSTEEWIGKDDNSALPRKRPGEPMTLAYFEKRSTIDPISGCWIWRNAIRNNGYGAVRIAGVTRSAHRVAYEIAAGARVDVSLDVCHRCDVRACVNPAHMFVGTRADNMADCSRKGRIRVPFAEGEACPNSKLSAAEVIAIRADPRSNRATARAYGVAKCTVSSIRKRLTWRSI